MTREIKKTRALVASLIASLTVPSFEAYGLGVTGIDTTGSAKSVTLPRPAYCNALDTPCDPPETVRPDGSVLKFHEHDLFQKAIGDGLANGFDHVNKTKGFYPVNFTDDVHLLMDRSGEGLLVNGRGLQEFLAGKPLSDENILDAYAPGMTFLEIVKSVASKIALVLAPGKAFTLEVIVRTFFTQAAASGLGAVLERAGVEIPLEINPLYHLKTLFEASDAERTFDLLTSLAEKDQTKYQEVLDRFPPVVKEAILASKTPEETKAVLGAYFTATSEKSTSSDILGALDSVREVSGDGQKDMRRALLAKAQEKATGADVVVGPAKFTLRTEIPI